MSAVSMNVTPRSGARLMVAIDSSQSVGPYHSLIPMQPSPCADTVRSPSLVVRMLMVIRKAYELERTPTQMLDQPVKVTVTWLNPSEDSMPSSMPSVFFCAWVSNGLCLAAVSIFCSAIWYTCCWLFGLPEKKLPTRLNRPCCSAYTYDWFTSSWAGSSWGLGSVTVTVVRSWDTLRAW